MKRLATLLSVPLFMCTPLCLAASPSFESVRFTREIRSDLTQPVDVALAETGDIYLLDQKTLQVKIYDAMGNFRRQFGGKNRSAGGLSRPVALAVGPGGTVIIADERQNKVLIFDEQGKFISDFGGPGKASGQFGKLRDVAVDRFGLIYTADAGNRTVSRFSDRGILLSQSRFKDEIPEQVVLDPAGNVYVLMSGINQVFKLDLLKTKINWTRVRLKPAVKNAAGLFVDHKGDLYITQGRKNNIVKYHADGVLLASFGSRGKSSGAFSGPTRLAGNDQGELLVIDSGNKRAQVFAIGGNDRPSLQPITHSPPTVALKATELLNEPINDLLWQSIDLQLRLFGKSARVLSKGLETRVFGGPGKINGKFRSPRGVAMLPDGRIVVSDTGNHRVQIFEHTGAITSFGERGKENGFFNSPVDVAVNSESMLFVTDSENSRVQIFTDQGIFMHSFGHANKPKKGQPAPLGALNRPTSLAIDSQDRVYVLDSGNLRVASFDARGEPIAVIGGFESPADITIDSLDNLYIADNNCHCVMVVSPDGKRLMQFGSLGNGPGNLGQITAIAAGENQVYVADAKHGKLKVFDVTMAGVEVEDRLKLTHSFYVPESIVGDTSQMARYRSLAMEDVAAKLAEMAGVSPAEAKAQLRTDKEVVLPGGEVQLFVSMAKTELAAIKPEDVPLEEEDELELTF